MPQIVSYNESATTMKIRRRDNTSNVFENFNETRTITKTRIEWRNTTTSILIPRKGYEIHKNGTCIPQCELECINGYCSAPDQCECNDDYSKLIINGYAMAIISNFNPIPKNFWWCNSCFPYSMPFIAVF